MASGALFPNITDGITRSLLLQQLLRTDRRIPSIETFLEDTKWLEPCSVAIRDRSYSKGPRAARLPDNAIQAFTRAYRSLFAFAWRHFPDLSGIWPKQDPKRPKQITQTHNDFIKHEFRGCAMALGFKAREGFDESSRAPEVTMVRKFLHAIRPPELFQMQHRSDEQLIHSICELLEKCYERSDTETFTVCIESTPEARCGRPSFLAWHAAKGLFTYNKIYCESENLHSAFRDQRDIFVMFLGTEYDELGDQESCMIDIDEQGLSDRSDGLATSMVNSRAISRPVQSLHQERINVNTNDHNPRDSEDQNSGYDPSHRIANIAEVRSSPVIPFDTQGQK